MLTLPTLFEMTHTVQCSMSLEFLWADADRVW